MTPSESVLPSPTIETGRPGENRWRKRANLLLVLLISAVSLWLAMRNVDAALMWRQMRSAKPAFLILAVCISAVTNLVRAVRWKVLLSSSRAVNLRPVYTSMMIGYMANNLLPARMGELVRMHVLARRTGIRKSLSAATIILERITDSLVLLAVVGLVSFVLPLPELIRRGSQIGAAVFIVIAIILLLLARGNKTFARLSGAMVGRLSHRLGHRVQEALEHFVDGLSILRSSKQALLVLGLTLMLWSIEAVSLGFVMKSLNLSLPWLAPLFLLVVLSLSFVIPAAPSGVGTYEFFAIAGLASFAVDKSQAAGLALLLHAIVYVTTIAVGFLCLAVEGLSVRELWAKKLIQEKPK